MRTDTAQRIGQVGGVVLFALLGLGLAELLGVIRVFTLVDFLVLFVGLGLVLAIVRWWAA
jgi:hypothetical protein